MAPARRKNQVEEGASRLGLRLLGLLRRLLLDLVRRRIGLRDLRDAGFIGSTQLPITQSIKTSVIIS
jgi:hypothetical protein